MITTPKNVVTGDLAVAEPRGFVDRDQPAEALVEVTAPPAVLVRSPLHVARPVDAHDVEHRRPDVDDRDQSRMPRVRRDHQARAKPGARSVAIVSRAVPPSGVGPTIATSRRIGA
jgi:hypothetical protein